MSGVALYSPEDVTILLGGVYPIDGIHDGSFVSISKDESYFRTSVTADGRVTRTHVNNPLFTVTLTLTSVSNTNQLFSAWAFADGKLYGAMIPLFIKDNNGTSLFFAPLSWIEEPPEANFDLGVSERVWQIKCAGATHSVGGNESGGGVDSTLASIGLMAIDSFF